MAYIINEADKTFLLSDALSVSGLTEDQIPADKKIALYYSVIADVGAYINDDFTEDAEQPTTAPKQIMQGVFVPMLAQRMACGMQTITSVSEGGSSAAFSPTYSGSVDDYEVILCRFKRLGFPRKVGAV